MNRLPHFLLVFLTLVLLSGQVLGATIRVSVVAPGQIHLEGVDFSDVAAADLTLIYDPGTLKAPGVTAGNLIEGALLASNPGVSGKLRLAFVHNRSIHGTGTVASISGEPQGNLGIKVLDLQGTLRDPQGQALPFRVDIPPAANPPQLSSPASRPVNSDARQPSPGAEQPETTPSPPGLPADLSSSPETPSAPASGYAGIASLTFPQERQSQPEPKEDKVEWAAESPPAYPPVVEIGTRPPKEATSRTEDSGPSRESEIISLPSVLSRFQEYHGPRTISHMSLLFENLFPPFVTQVPRVAFADGRTPVMLRIESVGGGGVPSVALTEGRVLRVGRGAGGFVEIEVLPEEGSWRTTVIALDEGRMLEIPLVVVPRVKRMDRDHCVQFQAGEKERATELPRVDINGDSQSDALDDYLLTASCLAPEQMDADRALMTGEAKVAR